MSAAFLDMELTVLWDVFSLLHYSLGHVSVCCSVLFRGNLSSVIDFRENLLQPALVLELISKPSSFGYDGVGNVTIKLAGSSRWKGWLISCFMVGKSSKRLWNLGILVVTLL